MNNLSEFSSNADLVGQIKSLHDLTSALVSQMQVQNEVLAETRRQIQGQTATLRPHPMSMENVDAAQLEGKLAHEKILFDDTPVENTPVVGPVHYVMTDAPVHPEKFSGNKKSYGLQSFRLAIERVFTLSEGRFNSDYRKIIYIGNLLEGPAQSWFNAMQSSCADDAVAIMNDVEIFWRAMSRHFGVKNSVLEKELEFLEFCQDRFRVSDYAIRFRQLASTLRFNDAALRAIFIKNLNSKAKRALRNQNDIPESLDAVIELCIRSDSEFLDFGNRSVVSESRPYFNRDSSWAGQTQQVAAIEGQSKLECNYCRQVGHIKKFCPRLPQGGLKKPRGPGSYPKGPATRL